MFLCFLWLRFLLFFRHFLQLEINIMFVFSTSILYIEVSMLLCWFNWIPLELWSKHCKVSCFDKRDSGMSNTIINKFVFIWNTGICIFCADVIMRVSLSNQTNLLCNDLDSAVIKLDQSLVYIFSLVAIKGLVSSLWDVLIEI